MFGVKMKVDLDGITIRLRPFCKEDIPFVTNGFQNMGVLMYTRQLFAQTMENELDWYEKVRNDKDTCTWAITYAESDEPVGVTGLHNIDQWGSCVSGIIIWKKELWKKGIATRAHLARTMYAADFLNRYTIKSHVFAANEGSLRALQRIGYILCGKEPRTEYRKGKFMDSYHLVWLNPERLTVLYPDGIPEEYREVVTKARKGLELAREVVALEV